MTVSGRTPRSGAKHPGPPPAAAAFAFVGLFVSSLVIGPVLGSGTLPSPYASPESVVRFVVENSTVLQVAGLLQLLAALALTVLSGLLLSRLQFLAPNAPGPTIAAMGGVVAAVLLAVSAMLQTGLAQTAEAGVPGLTHALHSLVFLSGGPAHTAALGILVLGAAVTSWFLRRLPRWIVVTGLLIAAVALASSLTGVLPVAPLVPLGRFAALVWLVALSSMLPRERAARRRVTTDSRATVGAAD